MCVCVRVLCVSMYLCLCLFLCRVQCWCRYQFFCVCVSLRVCTCVFELRAHGFFFCGRCVFIYACARTCRVRKCAFTHTNTYIYVYTHTNTHKHKRGCAVVLHSTIHYLLKHGGGHVSNGKISQKSAPQLLCVVT